MQHFPKPQYCF